MGKISSGWNCTKREPNHEENLFDYRWSFGVLLWELFTVGKLQMFTIFRSDSWRHFSDMENLKTFFSQQKTRENGQF